MVRYNGCIIFSVGERKFSPNAKFFAKNRNIYYMNFWT